MATKRTPGGFVTGDDAVLEELRTLNVQMHDLIGMQQRHHRELYGDEARKGIVVQVAELTDFKTGVVGAVRFGLVVLTIIGVSNLVAMGMVAANL